MRFFQLPSSIWCYYDGGIRDKQIVKHWHQHWELFTCLDLEKCGIADWSGCIGSCWYHGLGWCGFILNGLVACCIGVPTKYTYSYFKLVHYVLSNIIQILYPFVTRACDQVAKRRTNLASWQAKVGAFVAFLNSSVCQPAVYISWVYPVSPSLSLELIYLPRNPHSPYS